MTAHRLSVPPGDHVLEESIEGCRIEAFDGQNDLAKLVLSVKSPPKEARGEDHPSTTLAIYMEREAAMKLLVALHEHSNALGWLLNEPIGRSGAKFQQQVSQPRPK